MCAGRSARGSRTLLAAAIGGLLALTAAIGGCLPSTFATRCTGDAECPVGYTCNMLNNFCTALDAAQISADGATSDRRTDATVGDHVADATVSDHATDGAASDRVTDAVVGDRIADAAAGDRIADAAHADLAASDQHRTDAHTEAGVDAAIGDRRLVEPVSGDGGLATTDAALGFDASCACSISNICIDYHVTTALSPCQWCDPSASRSAWSDHDGTFCSSSQFFWCSGGSFITRDDCYELCDSQVGCCGGLDQPCCPTGQACAVGDCGVLGRCVDLSSCGEIGQPCCATDAQCSAGVCDMDANCVEFCGSRGDPCCVGASCSGSFVCCDQGSGYRCLDAIEC